MIAVDNSCVFVEKAENFSVFPFRIKNFTFLFHRADPQIYFLSTIFSTKNSKFIHSDIPANNLLFLPFFYIMNTYLRGAAKVIHICTQLIIKYIRIIKNNIYI